MAAASVLAPSSHYQPPPAFAASTYPSHSSGPSPTPSMVSSSEPRRSADDNNNNNDAPARQSLPSISEVFSGARPGQYPPPPSHSSLPPQPSPGGLPPPFAAPSHQYSDSDKNLHSPKPRPPASSTPDGIFATADLPIPPFSGHPGLPPVTDRSLIHDALDSCEFDRACWDYPSVSGGYPQPPAPASHPYQPSRMPSGQMPLPGYPISPRHEHYNAPRPQTHGNHSSYARGRYDATPRHYENRTYQETLSGIGSHSRLILNFAEAYRIEQGGQSPPERLPSQLEVIKMISNVNYIKRSLEQVGQVVHHTERAGEAARAAYEEGRDVNMYNDGMKPHYPVNEVKKRRGRAAPPGRCHSCNRIDTPEWRRGPNGARTLCNACGLHYAKLERKRQLEARSLLPTTEERG